MAQYQSQFKNLKLIIKPVLTQITNFGKKRIPGHSIQFENGMFTTDDKTEREFIEKHAFFARKEIIRVKTKEEQEDAIIKAADKIKAKKTKKK